MKGLSDVHVGVIGPHAPDLFAANVGEVLIGMGHRVTFLGSSMIRRGGRMVQQVANTALTASPRFEAKVHTRLATRARERECDAVINVEGVLAPAAVEDLHRHRIPLALWYPDAVINLGRARCLVAPYTTLFFKDPLLVQRLRDMLGLPVQYLPESCNARWHRPIGEAGTEPHIAIVGNTYITRLLLIRRLHDAGIPLKIYGGATPRWARHLIPAGLRVHPPIFREEKSRVFRGAAGVLNNLHPGEMHSVNRRLFEAAGAGAAILCEDRPALADLFDTEREVVPFTTFDELVDRASQLLADARLTRDIGDAASKRAHAEHTYEARLEIILDRLA